MEDIRTAARSCRRVIQQAGMRHCGRRMVIEDGESVDLVAYEAVVGCTDLDTACGDDHEPC
jgi:hypothetical protein